MKEQRRLAAIVSADVAGYSRLMGRDESGTVARLRRARVERLEPVLARHGGRIVKLTGDGALIEFASAVETLPCDHSSGRCRGLNDGRPNSLEQSLLLFALHFDVGQVNAVTWRSTPPRTRCAMPPGRRVVAAERSGSQPGFSICDLQSIEVSAAEPPEE